MGVKEFYYSIEEKYYNFLDKVNETLPVYSIVDPIDKVVPSFILFMLLGVMLILLLIFGVSGIVLPGGDNYLTISIVDSSNKAVDGASVTFLRGSSVVGEATTSEFGVAKLGGVTIDEEIGIRVEKSGYGDYSTTIPIFELPSTQRITIRSESASFTTKTIRLLDELGQPVFNTFTLKFKCLDNPYAPAISSVTISSSDAGVATVQIPNSCARVSVDVSDSSNFKEINGRIITGDNILIYLQEETVSGGKITINVSDAQGNPANGLEARLYKYSKLVANPNIGPINQKFVSSGQATFDNVYPGAYVVKTYDALGNFAEQTSARIDVSAGDTKTISMTVTEDVKGQIIVKIVDKKSKAEIEDATVKLIHETTKEELTTRKTDEDGKAVFNISKSADYTAIVTADSYKSNTVSGLRISTDAYAIELEKCTPSTCGALNVKVVDEDNNPVQNATVVLYDSATNFIASARDRTTDINGTAKFFDAKTGTYYAFAFKEGFSGRSDASYFNSSIARDASGPLLVVTMQTGDGMIGVNVKDQLGRPVPFTRFSVYDARDNSKIGSDITDANGSKELELRANRRVYIIAGKNDNEAVYADYVTSKKVILPSTVQEFNINLVKPIINTKVEMKFLGLFINGKQSTNVKAGETYTAKFKLFVPEDKEYETMGIHLRTGNDILMEKDELLLREVNAPRTSQIRATMFEAEKSNLDEEDYEFTNDDAKWANLGWEESSNSGLLAGVYEVEAEVYIKESAALGDKLFLYYRTWGENSDARDRFPSDDTIDIELYSNTKQEIFQVGIITLCDTDFCFTSTITDNEEGLLENVTDNYNARVFNPYKLQFVITNNSDFRIHNNANMRIDNPDETIKFFDYSMTNAETRTTTGVVNGFEFERLDTGNLLPKNSIRMETDFTPQKAITGIINIKLVSDQVVVFEKNLNIIVNSPRQLKTEIEPSGVYLSGIQNDITVTVKDAATDLEVEGAIVRLKDKRKNILDFATTKKDGTAKLTMPGQKPGEKITLEVEMIDYDIYQKELSVTDKLLDINPSQIGVNLNTKNKQESEETISVRNVAPYDLKIKDIKLQGRFKNLIDSQQVRNWLEASYKGMTIASEDKVELKLKTFLSEDAQTLKNRTDLEGTLVIIASNFGQEWLFEVPVKIAISLGETEVDPSCLTITRTEWVTSTSGSPKTTEFQIQNNCTVSGNPISLRQLEAKLDLKGNQIGEYALAFGENKAQLRPGYYRILLGTLEPEQAITMILTFTPFGGVNGVSEADVVLQATNQLDEAEQLLQVKIATKITSINLKQCISYDKERLIINQGETGTFTITADESCGEPIEFKVESPLSLSPSKGFTISPGESQVIEVFAEQKYPGQYPLFVSPQFVSNREEQLAKNLKIIINATGCWQLSKYEYDVYDSPTNDYDGWYSSMLTNLCVEKPVEVKVKAKDFMDALQDGAFYGLASMAAVMLSNWTNPEVDWLGRKEGEKETDKPSQKIDSKNYYYDAATGKWFNVQSGKLTEVTDKALLQQLNAGNRASGFYQNELGRWMTIDNGRQREATPKEIEKNNLPVPSQAAKEVTAGPSTATRVLPEPANQETPVPENPVLPEPVDEEEIVILPSATIPESDLLIPRATGLPSLFGGGPQGGSGLFGSNQSLLGGLFGGAGGLITGILGNNPISAGIVTTAGATMLEYSSQEDEITFVTLQKDVEIKDVTLVNGEGDLEQENEDIELEVLGLRGVDPAPNVPQPLVNNPDLISQGIEVFKNIFTNATGFITQPEEPKYVQLKVTGERHKYTDKVYKKEDFFDEDGGFLGFFDDDYLTKDKTDLEEDAPETQEQRFNLEFHSVPPTTPIDQPIGLLDCQDGTRIGSTGYDALPKVKFNWTWAGIGEDECNEDNENGIYCDATQFSISILKKIKNLDDYLKQNGSSLTCPSPRENEAAENEIGSYDVGVASVQTSKNGNEIKVTARIENTNPGIAEAKVTIDAVPIGAGGTFECEDNPQEITIAAGGFEDVECTFSGVPEAFYEAVVTIEPSFSCENCEDIMATNTLARKFYAGETGLEACEPYSTSRLDLFLEASGVKSAEADKMIARTKFNALLMADGYSTDFQKDFDLAQAQSFFSAPDYYLDKEKGLNIYFKNPSLFSFDAYSQPDFELPGPGTYNVIIDIEYKDGSWELLDAKGNPNAKITVRLEKLNGADPDSPFYYLPLNGQVGIGSGRVGYGVNFAGDSIIVDNSREPIRTVEITGSSPIQNGLLTVAKSDSFQRMQVDDRGIVARLSRARGNPTLLYQPSNATPVILEITKNGTGDAYAIYEIGVDGAAVDVGTTLTYWSGIGASCKAFNDTTMSEQVLIADTHGIGTRCAPTGSQERTRYALEFCEDPINFGSVFYETVFYTPQTSNSFIKLAQKASDSASLIGSSAEGSQVSLNGNSVTSKINSVQDIFDLVKEDYMCVSGTSISTEFFWNPKKLYTTIANKEQKAIDQCIR